MPRSRHSVTKPPVWRQRRLAGALLPILAAPFVGVARDADAPQRAVAVAISPPVPTIAPVAPSTLAHRLVAVATREVLLRAIADAQPGDIITLQPGTYRFGGSYIGIDRPGKAGAPIVLRAERPGSAVLELRTVEGFRVSAPYWSFENLTLRGTCAQHADCEHAFHVVGGALHFIARNNTLTDFNAHFKINGEGGLFPDHGLIEHNTIENSKPRQTDQPVTLIDLVAASHWTIRGNLIRDFVKAGGDQISYGAFAKGGGSDNRFERNIVLCEAQMRGLPGSRVGLSLGGGGTGAAYCRAGRCITEQDGSAIVSNLIASCSDDGIFLNRAANSQLLHNTLIDTGGISVRFDTSSAVLAGNLVDGAIRSRDGGLIHDEDNHQTAMPSLYLGHHSLRALFRDTPAFDFNWRGAVPRREAPAPRAAGALDLCGEPRPERPAYGAFEDFSACIRSDAASDDRQAN